MKYESIPSGISAGGVISTVAIDGRAIVGSVAPAIECSSVTIQHGAIGFANALV